MVTVAQQEIIRGLREHALRHYDEDGWDYIVEAYDDEELVEELEYHQLLSVEQAIGHFRKVCRLYQAIDEERRADARNSMF